MPTASSEWPTTLALAQREATQARFDAADSALAVFARGHAGSQEALETAYWRALLKLDPMSRTDSLKPAMALLDAYLADERPRQHAFEAAILRRVATHLETLAARAMVAAAVPQREVVSTPKPEIKTVTDPAAEAEIKRLKDELAKANAELERIRKRLIRPPT